MSCPVVLASASPRRRELLAQVGVEVRVAPHPVDERPQDQEAPKSYVLRMALEKLEAALVHERGLVLAADTIVTVDGVTLGKPENLAHNVAMLEALSGRAHEVTTAVAVAVFEAEGKPRVSLESDTTLVHFAELDAAAIRAYADTGEGLDKAGGYAIQGLAAGFVSRIEGSYSTVVGLPLELSLRMLRDASSAFVWPPVT